MAGSAARSDRLRSKHDYTFLVADVLGDVRGGADGLFTNDTRVLSFFRLTIGGLLPSLLGSGVSTDNVFLSRERDQSSVAAAR
jgi:hypothetical protein